MCPREVRRATRSWAVAHRGRKVAKTDTKLAWNRRFWARLRSTENPRRWLAGPKGGTAGPWILVRTSVLPRPNSRFVCSWEVRPYSVTSAVPRFCLGQTHFSCAHGRCDLTTAPRPYLGFALVIVTFCVFRGSIGNWRLGNQR